MNYVFAGVRESHFALCSALAIIGWSAGCSSATDMRAPIIFTRGHETDPQDGGRPVVLVAAGLGVPPEVFREAFRGVTPARGGPPTGEQVHRNKQALLKVLGPHGVTNERLDEVSDYYRYRPERGEIWTSTSAEAHAIIENGRVARMVVTNPGAGYSSPPTATIKGHESVPLQVELLFDKDLSKNGSVQAIKIIDR